MKTLKMAGSVLLAFSLLISCGETGFESEYVDCLIVMPIRHPALASYEDATGGTWTVRWVDADGTRHRLAGIREQVVIAMPAHGVTPVLLLEESDLPGFTESEVPPAGALFPFNAVGGRVRPKLYPDRIGGIAARCAELALENAAGGHENGRAIVAAFNWPRLQQCLGKLGHPGRVDLDLIASRILTGSFSSRYVSENPVFSARIPAGAVREGEHPIIPANPLNEPGIRERDGSITLEVTDGMNRFFTPEGTLDVWADAGHIVCTFFHPCD